MEYFHCFQDDEVIKEQTAEDQNIGDFLIYSRQLNMISYSKKLPEDAIKKGEVFQKIANEEIIPTMPNGEQKFHIKTDKYVGFRGVGGKDLAKIFHFLIIPRKDAPSWIGDAKNFRVFNSISEMKKIAKKWIELNRNFFRKRYPNLIAGKNVDYWLSNPQMGFHIKPSVGYLHMHVLIGPLTEFGCENINNWFSV